MAPGFAEGLHTRGDAPALVLARDGRIVSYGDLDRRIAVFADRLGGNRGLLAIEAAPEVEVVVAYLAALRAGWAVAMLAPGEASAAAAIRDRFKPEASYRCAGGDWRLERHGSGGTPLHPDLALMLLTSGSTGEGKAVRLSSAALSANAAAIAGYLELTSADRAALVLPLCYSYGLSVLHSHLAAGASLLIDPGSILDPGFPRRLQAAGCTNLSGVPYSFELLEGIGLRGFDLPALRFMTVAGGRLDPALVRTYQAHLSARGGRFFVMYGQTEATARIAYLPPELAATAPDRIGIAIPGGELGLIDTRGRPITAAEAEGELVYRGPNVMMGYAASRADLARDAGPGELRTGDLAIRDARGLYRITGRTRRISKIGGRRIAHDAVEVALLRHGLRAAVVGDDDRILAAIAGETALPAMRSAVAEAAGLPVARVTVRLVPELPRLAGGKLDYPRLQAWLREVPAASAPQDGIEMAFRETFFPRPVSAADSFLSLGGDSLRHVELSMLLEHRLGHLPAGWEQMPIAELDGQETPASACPRLEPHLIIRALAIILVVIQHATHWPLPVGSTAMMILVGYSLGRFQRAALAEGDFRRFFRPLAAVLVPYYLIVAGYALAWGQVPWASVFLSGNFGFAAPERQTMLPHLYWFIEAFAQALLVWAAVFLVPAVRREASRDPFRVGLWFLAAAVAARFTLPEIWPLGVRQIFALPWVLYLTAFGWCAASAATGRQRLILIAAAATVLPLAAWDGGNWTGSWVRYGMQLPVIAALIYLPAVAIPRAVASAVLIISAGGYHIYLVHRFAPELLMLPLEPLLSAGGFALLSVVGGIALGLATHRAQRLVRHALAAGPRDDRAEAGLALR